MSQPDGLISQASWPKSLMEIYVPFVDHTDARSVAGCGTDDCAE
jgi:hypothetical protein